MELRQILRLPLVRLAAAIVTVIVTVAIWLLIFSAILLGYAMVPLVVVAAFGISYWLLHVVRGRRLGQS